MVQKIQALKHKWLIKMDRARWLSLALHLGLIGLLIFTVPMTPKNLQISGPAKVQIVNATFINSAPVQTPPLPQPKPETKPTPAPAPVVPKPEPVPASKPQVKPKPMPKPAIKPAPHPVTKPKPKPRPKPQSAPKKMLVIEAKQAEIKKTEAQEKALQQKKLALKKQAQELAQKAAELRKQQAAQALKAMALNSIQSEVKTQQQQAAAAAAQQRLLSLKEQYMALIQQTIRANWINQFDPDQNLTTTLHINLDSQGNVLSVSITQSSGNPTFDRQAILAVKKSSPLPMPQDPTLLKDFLSITLPFSNQGGS